MESCELSEQLDCTHFGESKRVNIPTSLNNPRSHGITFCVDIEKSYDLAKHAASLGSTIISSSLPDFYNEAKHTFILANNPRLTFARMLSLFFVDVETGQISAKAVVHEKAIVHPSATIKDYAHVGSGSIIGENCVIEAGVVIGKNVTIGRNCLVKANSVIGQEGFGVEPDELGNNVRIPQIGGVVIGENVMIGSLTTICSGTLEPTSIADHVMIDDHVHVAHNCTIGMNSILTACVEISGSVLVGSNVWIGPNSSIRDGLVIGENAFIGIGSVITKNCDSNGVYVGVPGRKIRSK